MSKYETMGKYEIWRKLADEIMLADDSIPMGMVTRTTTVLLRQGINDVSKIKYINIADAVDWDGCGNKMIEVLVKLGAHGEVSENQKPRDKRVLVCPSCGSDMKFGSRVNVTLSWEGTKSDSWGYENPTSRSMKVCRRCAKAMCDEYGLGGVVELVRGNVE